MKKLSAALLAVSCLLTFGCYNSYIINRTEFEKLQTSEQKQLTVRTTDGKNVKVNWNTRLFARSQGGRKYQITPFNFKVSGNQLVASDRDLLLEINAMRHYEVQHFSTWKTVGWAALGLAAAAGMITAVILTAKSDKGFN